jgi:hypothetical protein
MNTEPISFDEYRKTAQLTATYPGKGENILYPALGLCGEASELYEKYCQCPEWIFNTNKTSPMKEMPHSVNLVLKECGDWLWYMADIATELNIDLWSEWQDYRIRVARIAGDNLSDYILDLCYQSGKIAEEAKKQLRDNKEIDLEIAIGALCRGLDIIKLVANYYTESSAGLYVVARMNNEKLLARREAGTICGSGDER